MDDLSRQILNHLNLHPDQLAREMAKALGVDKKQINSRLYGRLKDTIKQATGCRWSLTAQQDTKKQSKSDEPQYQNTNLARLCRYYLACMGQDEVGVSVFAQSKSDQPDYKELMALPANSETLFSEEGCQLLLGKIRKEQGRKDLYLGYPTSLKLLKSRKSSGGRLHGRATTTVPDRP